MYRHLAVFQLVAHPRVGGHSEIRVQGAPRLTINKPVATQNVILVRGHIRGLSALRSDFNIFGRDQFSMIDRPKVVSD